MFVIILISYNFLWKGELDDEKEKYNDEAG